MIKKVLFVGDNHISSKTPINRLDNYMEATLSKLQDCVDIGKSENVDAIVLLGDLFDRREEGPEARNGALKILSQPRQFPIYITVGNHDIQSSFPLEKSSLGTLIEAGVLIKTDYDQNLGIAFAHFTSNLDEDIKNGFLSTIEAPIWSCHASLSDKLDRFEEFTILFESIPIHDSTKIVISGHIHHPMRQQRADGKIFINPGAIGRRSANKDNLSRDLKVLLLEYDLEGNIHNEEYLPLPSAKNHLDVFNIEKISSIKAEKKDAKEFIQRINQIKSNNWSFAIVEDKISALKVYAKSQDVEQNIIDVAIKAVEYVNTNNENKLEEFEL